MVFVHHIPIVADPIYWKSNMRNHVSTSIKLPFCFCQQYIRFQFVYDFTFGLILGIKYCKVYFCVSRYPRQRFCPFSCRFLEHSVELTTATLFTRKIFIFFCWIS